MALRFVVALFSRRLSTSSVRNFASMSAPPGNKVEVGGVKVHYERVGSGDHAVLLLPGALGTTRTDFGPQLTSLGGSGKLTVVAWDPPGYGFSRPPDRTFPSKFLHQDAQLAADFMAKLGFARYSLLGWSDGGITALILAATEPKAIRKLVAVAANAYVNETDVKLYDSIQNIDSWSPRMREPMIAMYGEDYFRKTWSGWCEAFKQIYKDGGNICKDELKLISCPTLLVQGAKDPVVPVEHMKFIQENIKGSRLEMFPEGKHNLHLRFAKEFNQMVEDFLLQD